MRFQIVGFEPAFQREIARQDHVRCDDFSAACLGEPGRPRRGKGGDFFADHPVAGEEIEGGIVSGDQLKREKPDVFILRDKLNETASGVGGGDQGRRVLHGRAAAIRFLIGHDRGRHVGREIQRRAGVRAVAAHVIDAKGPICGVVIHLVKPLNPHQVADLPVNLNIPGIVHGIADREDPVFFRNLRAVRGYMLKEVDLIAR